jgi:CubicO group peptidase (beta-lactamase class C family)
MQSAMRLSFAALAMVVAASPAMTAFAAASEGPLPTANPESIGMSTSRLESMAGYFRAEAAARIAAGYVLMVARNGKLVHAAAVGYRNIEQGLPMTLDTRFRIASMTKPITTVAVLMLYEQGRFRLDDPVARFLPEFGNPRVCTGVDAGGAMLTEPAKRAITIRDLLTHESGLGYLFDDKTPLGKAYLALKLDPYGSLADNVRRIAAEPLYFQPGEGWFYSYADDVLGRLVEVVSGMSFAEFLNERLFVPLRMNATGFYVPADARSLMVTMYRHDAGGALQAAPAYDDAANPKRWASGGGGLISTAGDYLRFAQMLANGGSLEGRQYLSPATVDLMTHNQVAESAMVDFWGAGSTGLGYGLGVGVEIDTRHATHAGYPGDFSWGGVFDTHWVASPRTGIVAILLTQSDPLGPDATRQRAANDDDMMNLLFAAMSSAAPPRADPMAPQR